MNKTIVKAPCIKMKKLESIFIEMTAKNCNLKCKHCYINFNEKQVKDFIPIDTVKNELNIIGKNKLEYMFYNFMV